MGERDWLSHLVAAAADMGAVASGGRVRHSGDLEPRAPARQHDSAAKSPCRSGRPAKDQRRVRCDIKHEPPSRSSPHRSRETRMATKIVIYQKPTCTTCRQVHKALKESGVD